MTSTVIITKSCVCPNCASRAYVRRERVGAADYLLSILGLYPFWCSACLYHGHRRPPSFAVIRQNAKTNIPHSVLMREAMIRASAKR